MDPQTPRTPHDSVRPAPVPADPYLVFEVRTARDLYTALEGQQIPGDTEILVKRGERTVGNAEKRSGPENLYQALCDQAEEDDREGARYAAVRGKYYLEKTPKKDVEVRWH